MKVVRYKRIRLRHEQQVPMKRKSFAVLLVQFWLVTASIAGINNGIPGLDETCHTLASIQSVSHK
jgi:hypothetical protein